MATQYDVAEQIKMHAWTFIWICFVTIVFAPMLSAQQVKDPCEFAKVQLASGNAPDLTLKDIKKDSNCWNNGFVRVIGIYRVSFENSDLYDPVDDSASAWVQFDPYYAAIKRCSEQNLKLLDRDAGGTFGFIALGVIRTKGRYGHMNGWTYQFDPICLEKVELLSKSGIIFQAHTKETRKKILDWYTREVKRLY